jgi:hypothetical protein
LEQKPCPAAFLLLHHNLDEPTVSHTTGPFLASKC